MDLGEFKATLVYKASPGLPKLQRNPVSNKKKGYIATQPDTTRRDKKEPVIFPQGLHEHRGHGGPKESSARWAGWLSIFTVLLYVRKWMYFKA